MQTDANLLAGGGAPPPEVEDDDGDFPFEETLSQFRAEAAQAGDDGADDDEGFLEPDEPEDKPEAKAEEPKPEPPADDAEMPRGLRERLAKAAKARDDARAEAQQRAAEAAEERRVREELEARLADMEARLADPEPDFDSDPDKWREWAKRDKAREVERAKKAREAKVETKPAAAQVDPAAQRVETSVAAARQRYGDYGRFVSPAVIARINSDPAVYDRVMGADDPGEAAYRYGREVILGEKKDDAPARPSRLASGGDGFAPAPAARRGPVTREEKYVSKFTSSWGLPGRNGGR